MPVSWIEEKFKGGLQKAFLKSKNRAPVPEKAIPPEQSQPNLPHLKLNKLRNLIPKLPHCRRERQNLMPFQNPHG